MQTNTNKMVRNKHQDNTIDDHVERPGVRGVQYLSYPIVSRDTTVPGPGVDVVGPTPRTYKLYSPQGISAETSRRWHVRVSQERSFRQVRVKNTGNVKNWTVQIWTI